MREAAQDKDQSIVVSYTYAWQSSLLLVVFIYLMCHKYGSNPTVAAAAAAAGDGSQGMDRLELSWKQVSVAGRMLSWSGTWYSAFGVLCAVAGVG